MKKQTSHKRTEMNGRWHCKARNKSPTSFISLNRPLTDSSTWYAEANIDSLRPCQMTTESNNKFPIVYSRHNEWWIDFRIIITEP